MTIRLLPEIDLARLAPLPDDIQRKQLSQMKSGYSTFSYKPVRACFGDIFNVQPPMFGHADPTPLEKINQQLARNCKSSMELENNTSIAKALHDFTSSRQTISRGHDFFPLAMSVGKKVSYWLPMVLAMEGQPYAVFVDPRRSRGLSRVGRRFAFSMMHERIRAADEDFSEVKLGIVRFSDGEGKEREVRFYEDAGVELFSMAELESMVSNTYRIWREVHEEQTAETRRKGTGTGGLF